MTRPRLLLCLCALGLLSAAGCRVGLGGHCQVTSDCDDGLYCVLPVGGNPSTGGTCQTANGPDMSTDMGMDMDDTD